MPKRHRHKFTPAQCAKGGRAIAAMPGGKCPRAGCGGKHFATRLALIGHKGLHGFADRFTGGDMRAAARMFNLIGQAATDPFPRNGAFSKAHKAWEEVKEQMQASN